MFCIENTRQKSVRTLYFNILLRQYIVLQKVFGIPYKNVWKIIKFLFIFCHKNRIRSNVYDVSSTRTFKMTFATITFGVFDARKIDWTSEKNNFHGYLKSDIPGCVWFLDCDKAVGLFRFFFVDLRSSPRNISERHWLS